MATNIKDKIAKLLALAESPNENEAKAALLKARELMAEQKSRARADALKKRHNVDLSVYDDFKKTLVSPIDFLGYTDMSARAKVIGIMQEGKGSVPAVTGPANVEVILDRTPFYAEAGGQLADQGEILSDDGAVLEVDDVQKPIKDLIVHQCRLTEGTLVVGGKRRGLGRGFGPRPGAVGHGGLHQRVLAGGQHAGAGHVLSLIHISEPTRRS